MNGLEDRDGLSETGEPPQGPGLEEQDNRVLVLPVNGDSRKLTQILSNETSLKILELLGKKSMSATNIAEELNLPLTTVKYNLDSLIESDLIKVKQIKWSQKGRQIKIYESVEKLIVLVPSRNSMDKLSIINLLQKYMGVIGAAFFAAAGIEYLSVYLRAKSIVDATAPLRMGITGPVNETYPEATIMESVKDEKLSPKDGGSNSTFDQALPEEGVMEEEVMEKEVMDASPETFAGQQVMDGSGAEKLPSEMDAARESGAAEVSVPDTLDSTPELPSVPPEGLTHLGGVHGLYDALSLHPGIWFLFGCIFVIFLVIVREVYYKKKTK
ncbi:MULTISPECIES: transcriptional regulator [unclassified Methanosarcina]|uniref:ArsR/SmtB family transcription factor n=1 Tax=unclassified Methanosarcina TaxID=2644672 RepID=UPI000615E2B8|nr:MULTISPECIES: winged helix-turn-helix domain-containing protein [unclassified Methanosarcina]AKB17004.1 putative transcriptional regulators [Methanosarcina sp. WWM596]AKB20414.1 putative transcriptional regulators [Methanosarcina sp. WH1]